MNLGQAIAQIQMLMGFRSDLAAQATTSLDLAQEFYERGPVYPWFLLSEKQTIITSVGERRIPVPANFIAENEESALYYDDADPDDDGDVQLGKHDYDYLIRQYGSTTTGKPESYSTDGLYFQLFPIPDDLYEISARFYKMDVRISTLSSDSTNKWLTYAPQCLIGWAGQQLATAARDVVAGGKFMQLEQQGQAQLQVQNEERKHSNRQYQIGGPHV